MPEAVALQAASQGPDARVAGSTIAAIAHAVPRTVVTNEPIAARLGVTPDWIVKRTGIERRHHAAPGERLTEFATEAGRAALSHAGLAPQDLDLVLVATVTADDVVPNAAPLVAAALGAERAGAFDVGAACTGFLAALSIADAQVSAGRAEHVLVIGAEVMSRITDPGDRRTAALFADGAGAAVVSPAANGAGVGPIVLGADGTRAEAITVARRGFIRMNGHDTFRLAVDRLAQVTEQVLDQAGLSPEDVDQFVYHQANGRILSAVTEALGLPQERVLDVIGSLGNTSAASVPIALSRAVEDGRITAGDRVLLAAFGAGLTWGAALLEWSDDGA
jgi:3-oxoacyl-[acyl-carrier-protein] synthase-3